MPERPQRSWSRDMGKRHYRTIADIDAHIAELMTQLDDNTDEGALVRRVIADLYNLRAFRIIAAMGHGGSHSHGGRVR